MSLEQLDDASYSALRSRLLRSKGSRLQREFLEAARSSRGFVEWMLSRAGMTTGGRLAVVEERLTEAQFMTLPPDNEQRLFDRWREVEPADACRASFWGCVTLRHIEHGFIEATHLAAAASPRSKGLERIDRALQGSDAETDDAARTMLRRLSGLPEARGNRSVYVDCPFARGWWRGHLAAEVVRETGARVTARDVLRVLGRSQTYWEDVMMFVVSRNSVLGDTKVRTALIWALADLAAGDSGGTDPVLTSKGLKSALRRVGIRSAWQELGVLPVDQLRTLMQREFLPDPAPSG